MSNVMRTDRQKRALTQWRTTVEQYTKNVTSPPKTDTPVDWSKKLTYAEGQVITLKKVLGVTHS